MKKIVLLLATALFSLVQLHAKDYDFEYNGIYYLITSTSSYTVSVAEKPYKYTGSVTIPSTVRYAGNNYSVTSIGSHAFEGCSGLTSVTIPNSVTSIGISAFFGCTGLTSLTIPNSVTSIGSYAFDYCTGLTSVTIPNSVTSIGNYAFESCKGLTSIKVDAGNPKYDSRNNCNAIIETASNTLIAGCKNTIIPNSVTSIGSGAFAYCKGLTSVTIPNSVTSIDDVAFIGCTGLREVHAERTNPNEYNCVSTAFDNISNISEIPLYVPEGCAYAYSQCEPWNKFNIINILATGVSLNRTTATLTKAGETVQLSATVLPENASNKNVTWSSSNESVATVSATGLVTAVANGTATITATTADGSNKKATCSVDVNILATGVTLNKTTATLTSAGATVQLTATVTPSNAGNKNVTWSSSNESVATVSATGLVTAVANGTATITATTADGSNKKATCSVSVKILATGVSLNRTSGMLTTGQTLQLTATVSPDNAANKNVTWTSSNSSVARVSSNGLVTAVANGTAIITATTADGSNKSASCTITVMNPPTGVVSSDIRTTRYWFASGSMTAGSGKEEIHVNTLVPGSGASTDEVFVTNLLSTFSRSVVKCTPENASLNDTLTIVFDTSAYRSGIQQKGQSGRVYTMSASEDEVFASYGNETMPVVRLLDSYNNKDGRYAEFRHNDFAHDLLNAYPTYNSDGQTTSSFYTLMTFADRKNELPMVLSGDTKFSVRYFRPINAGLLRTGKFYFNDASAQGYDELDLRNLFDFYDWRMTADYHFNTTKNPSWLDFYGITSQSITYKSEDVLTDLDDGIQPLSEVAPELSLTLSNGKIKYRNNGASVGKFSLFIPCHIQHYWGEFVQMLQIPVLGTMDKVEDITIYTIDELNGLLSSIGVSTTTISKEAVGHVYDIKGRIVMTSREFDNGGRTSLPTGIYIRNGKKIFIKNN